jgi:hypothetical protein
MIMLAPEGEPSRVFPSTVRKRNTNRQKAVETFHAKKTLRKDTRLDAEDKQLQQLAARFPDHSIEIEKLPNGTVTWTAEPRDKFDHVFGTAYRGEFKIRANGTVAAKEKRYNATGWRHSPYYRACEEAHNRLSAQGRRSTLVLGDAYRPENSGRASAPNLLPPSDVGSRYLMQPGEEGDRHRRSFARLIAKDDRRKVYRPQIVRPVGSAASRNQARQEEAERFWSKPRAYERQVIEDIETNFAQGWDHVYVNGQVDRAPDWKKTTNAAARKFIGGNLPTWQLRARGERRIQLRLSADDHHVPDWVRDLPPFSRGVRSLYDWQGDLAPTLTSRPGQTFASQPSLPEPLLTTAQFCAAHNLTYYSTFAGMRISQLVELYAKKRSFWRTIDNRSDRAPAYMKDVIVETDFAMQDANLAAAAEEGLIEVGTAGSVSDKTGMRSDDVPEALEAALLVSLRNSATAKPIATQGQFKVNDDGTVAYNTRERHWLNDDPKIG